MEDSRSNSWSYCGSVVKLFVEQLLQLLAELLLSHS